MSNRRNTSRRKKSDASTNSATNMAERETSIRKLPAGIWAIVLILVSIVAVLIFFRNPISTDKDDQLRIDPDLQQKHQNTGEVQRPPPRNDFVAEKLLFDAQTAKAAQNFDRAITLLNMVEDRHGEVSVQARMTCAELMLDRGRIKESEAQLRRAFTIDPENPRVNQKLAYLLNVLGRRYESSAFAFQTLKAEGLRIDQLILFSNRHQDANYGKANEVFVEKTGGNPSARLNEVRRLIRDEESSRAIPILNKILQADSESTEAYVLLGKAHWATSDKPNFALWYSNASNNVKEHPDFWQIVGDWALDHDQPAVAARAYWEALRIDPDIQQANYQLAKLLKADSLKTSASTDLIATFQSRSELDIELYNAISDIVKNLTSRSVKELGENVKRVILASESLGRRWEAFVWTEHLKRIDSDTRWADSRSEQLKSELTPSVPRYVDIEFPANEIDLSHLPLLKLETDGSRTPRTEDLAVRIQFSDKAAEAGIEFTFYNAPQGADTMVYTYQQLGASVGVVDFNLDGLPDIYFPQGCDWPIATDQMGFLDKLYLNLGNGTFKDITTLAGVVQNGFGQSITVGDFDSDGFPDIYLANLGSNRLLRNNGDGTYSDVTDDSGSTVDDWTCAAAMVDLNGDSLPDIYDVNYLDGDDVFTKVCEDLGVSVSCGPRIFKSTQDRIRINRGDGTFDDMTDKLHLPPGKGLGIVAGNFNGDNRIDLLIANDGEPNFFLINESGVDGLAFSDAAAGMGVDVNGKGDAQACMGIAVLDLNRDGQVDFFITNYWKEHNILYLSEEFGFEEATRRANLSSPGYEFVGFGTQALDAELDNDDDLLVTNGNVRNYRLPERPFTMPSMFLENTGNGRFQERKANEVGSYFKLPQVGRGMARLDWNRDGLQEVVIGNLDRPAVLLKNESRPAGGFISVRLIGVESDRDAIGSQVTVISDGETMHRQLTAGDGYGASNQRELVFAVSGSNAESVRVKWPNGTEQTYRNVSSDKHYIAIEGSDELFPNN